MDKVEIKLEPVDNRRLLNLCGPLNNNIKDIESRFDVEINHRGNLFYFVGIKKNITIASRAIKDLYQKAENNDISQLMLKEYLDQPNILKEKKSIFKDSNENYNSFNFKNYRIKIENSSQKIFYNSILKDDLVFSIGAAGSGKTFLAIGAALHCYELNLIKKIVLVRPAVEAGENLGFLPGDLSQKIDPYLRPMYDALNTIIG